MKTTMIAMLSLSLQGYYNAVKPDFGADWTLRFQI